MTVEGTTYIAKDGLQFDTKSACISHEQEIEYYLDLYELDKLGIVFIHEIGENVSAFHPSSSIFVDDRYRVGVLIPTEKALEQFKIFRNNYFDSKFEKDFPNLQIGLNKRDENGAFFIVY